MAAQRCLFGLPRLQRSVLRFEPSALAEALLHARSRRLRECKKMPKKAAVFWAFVCLYLGVGFRFSNQRKGQVLRRRSVRKKIRRSCAAALVGRLALPC